jgi:hypothetical protein
VETEEHVVRLRQVLSESDLGQCGARAIQQALREEGLEKVPSVRTIGRILERRGLLDSQRRMRRAPPPKGWYLPEVAAGRAELDSFDVVEGLVIEDGPGVEVLNGVSLLGGLVVSFPRTTVTARASLESILEHWREFGLPAYAQFDNDTLFQGPHQYADAIGRVVRMCLSLGVVPVFVPPREPGFQAAVENYNGEWQSKVWARFHHSSLAELQQRSQRYVAAHRASRAQRIDAAPPRAPFPERWRLNLQASGHGRIFFLRRTNEHGETNFLGRRFLVDPQWLRRLVRAEVDLDQEVIRFYGLRRRQPGVQPLLRTIPYCLPNRRFKE